MTKLQLHQHINLIKITANKIVRFNSSCKKKFFCATCAFFSILILSMKRQTSCYTRDYKRVHMSFTHSFQILIPYLSYISLFLVQLESCYNAHYKARVLIVWVTEPKVNKNLNYNMYNKTGFVCFEPIFWTEKGRLT